MKLKMILITIAAAIALVSGYLITNMIQNAAYFQ